MYRFTIDENKDKKYIYYKRHFWHHTPRLVAMCRVFGHKPTVGRAGAHPTWFECARCGTRPVDQYDLFSGWSKPEGGFSLEVPVWSPGKKTNWAFNFRVGGDSSERTFKGHVDLGFIAIYWGLEGYGEGLRRRLIKRGDYETRVFQLAWHDGTLWSAIWEKSGHWSRSDPWWMSNNFNPKDFFLGRQKHSSEVLEEKRTTVPMPEGSYPATVKLERATWKRPRWPRPFIRYSTDIKPDHFIPVPGKGENSWDCGDDGVWSQSGPCSGPDSAWASKAVAGLVEAALRDRERYAGPNWKPAEGFKV